MKKIIKLLGSVLISTSAIPYNMFVNTNHQQKKIGISTKGRKTLGVIQKYFDLQGLKVWLKVNYQNIVYFKDIFENIYFEDEGDIYILKKDWLTSPVKLSEIKSKVNVIVADNYNNIFFGTENGIYKRSVLSETITKIKGTDENIKYIVVDKNNNIYVGTEENAYILNEMTGMLKSIFEGWVIGLSVDNKNNLYIAAKNGVYKLNANAEEVIELSNPEGFDENELKLVFPRPGANQYNTIWDYNYARLVGKNAKYHEYKNERLSLEVLYNFNLGTVNPLYYKKFKFLGRNFDNFFSKISWGNTAIYGNKPSDFNGSLLKNKILNKKLYSNDFIVFDNNNLSKIFKVQDFNQTFALRNQIWGKQFFILSYYFERGNYYLQFSVAHNVLTKGLSHSGGGIWMDFGYGISLYND